MIRVAVVGHVEWVEFAVVPRLPHAGEIVHAGETLALPGGSGASVAVGLRKLAGAAAFFTAVGADDVGEGALADLRGPGPERRGLLAALPRVPLALGSRRAVTADIERQLRLLAEG